MPGSREQRVTFSREVRRRLLPHAAVFWILWPLASAVSAPLDLKSQPMTSRLPWGSTFVMLLRAQPQLVSEWFFIGFLGTAISALLFALLSVLLPRESSTMRLAQLRLPIEPLLLMLAVLAGIATEYPAVLAHPFLQVLRILTVRFAIL